MACIVCDGKLDCGAHCVMGSWTAQPTVGHVANVVRKSVFLMKRSRLAVQLLGVVKQANFYVTYTLILCYIAL